MRIGFDVGGVLASTLEERKIVGPDETEIFRLEPPFEGALEVLCALARVVGGENLFIISRACGTHRIEAVWALLRSWNFSQATGLPEENVFVYSGGRDEKARFVAQHGIDCMVDDRVEVLTEMDPSVRVIAFNPVPKEMQEFLPKLAGRELTVVTNWAELGRHFGV